MNDIETALVNMFNYIFAKKEHKKTSIKCRGFIKVNIFHIEAIMVSLALTIFFIKFDTYTILQKNLFINKPVLCFYTVKLFKHRLRNNKQKNNSSNSMDNIKPKAGNIGSK